MWYPSSGWRCLLIVVLLVGGLWLNSGCDCRSKRQPDGPSATSADTVIQPPQAVSPVDIVEAVDQLADSIQQRLAIMPDVARFKWNHKRPITDPEREAQLLKSLVQQATEHGVSPQLSQRFLTAQMAAARHVQQRLIADWQAAQAEPFADVPDLDRQLRPQISALSAAMLSPLIKIESVLADAATQELLANALQQRSDTAPLFAEELKMAFAPLMDTQAGSR